jgi:hypothetical protein
MTGDSTRGNAYYQINGITYTLAVLTGDCTPRSTDHAGWSCLFTAKRTLEVGDTETNAHPTVPGKIIGSLDGHLPSSGL